MKKTTFLVFAFLTIGFTQINFGQLYLDSEGNAGVGVLTSPNARMTILNSTEDYSLDISNTTDTNNPKSGLNITVSELGAGEKFGMRGQINHKDSNGSAYYAYVVGSGTGRSNGITAILAGEGGPKVGVNTSITQRTSDYVRGFTNSIYQYGNGDTRGISTELTHYGTGNAYGEYIGIYNNSTGYTTGLNVEMGGSGSGQKTGIFSRVPTGTNQKAGDFTGDVYIDGQMVMASDERLKENVETISGAMKLIGEMQPKKYRFKALKGHGNDPNLDQYGFLAQDLKTTLPELVKVVKHRGYVEARETSRVENGITINSTNWVQTEPDEEVLAVNYIALIPILTQAIKEQQLLIQALMDRVGELEQK